MAEMRRCIGSATFGIEAHDAPPGDFPIQPSQKDGLGRMCRPHWTEYTGALRKAALARKAATGQAAPSPDVVETKPTVDTSKRRAAKPAAAKGRKAKDVDAAIAPDAAPVAEA